MAFFAQFGEYPTEQASGQFGQLLMLVAAIEIAQSLDSNSVARELQRLKIQDIYGDFSYRKQEGMSAKPGLGVQFAPGSHDQDIIHPMGVSSGPLYFPTPTWKTRACRAAGASKCSANGYCSVSGKCICRPAAHGEWTGSACDEWEPYVPPPSWGAIVVAPVVSIVAGFLALAFARNHVRRKMLREGDKKRMHQTFKNIATSRFPATFVRFSTLKTIGKFVAHERMREAGKLLMFDSHEELVTATQNAPVVFLSHQWLAFDEPDPNNDHFLAAIEGIRLLCEHEELDPDALLVWFDYSSIPQKNMHTQQLAIDSLAIYASCCKYFIIIAPEAIHADSAIVCNAETYSKRGWCRLEQWARLTVGRTGMYLFGKDQTLQVLDDQAMDQWCQDSIMVFEGNFTIESDKLRISDTVLGLWSKAVIERKDSETSFLYDIVDKERSRVFPAAYYPRAQQDLVEKHLAREHVGTELKLQVAESRTHMSMSQPSVRTSSSSLGNALVKVRRSSAEKKEAERMAATLAPGVVGATPLETQVAQPSNTC